MNQNYQIVKYRPEFKEQVARLQTHLWSKDIELNLKYFEWKYEQNPYQDEPLVYLAVLGGEVVGMRGFVPSKWQAGLPPQIYDLLIADDMTVVPEHRNRGVVTKIMNAAFDDLSGKRYPYVINLGGSELTVLSSLSMGWRSIGGTCPVGRSDKTVRNRRRARQFVSRLRFFWRYQNAPFLFSASERRPFRLLDRATVSGGDTVSTHLRVEKRPRPSAMAELLERIPYDGRIRRVRYAEYFNRRFQNPRFEYRFLYWSGARLEAYAVLSSHVTDLRGSTWTSIVDIGATKMEARAELLNAIVKMGRFANLATWTATQSEEARALLDRTGFLPPGGDRAARGLPCMLVRPLRSRIQKPQAEWVLGDRQMLDMTNWELRTLDAPSS